MLRNCIIIFENSWMKIQGESHPFYIIDNGNCNDEWCQFKKNWMKNLETDDKLQNSPIWLGAEYKTGAKDIGRFLL